MNENSDNYMRIIPLLDEMKTLVNDPQDKILRRLDCYENIKIRYRMETEHLLHNIKKKFETLVQLNEKAFQSTKVVDVKITKDDNQLHDVLIALFKTKYNPKRVFDFLLDNVFAPIITHPVSIDFNNNDPKFAHLELSYSLKPLADDLRPNYKTVFQNIRTVFQCLGYMNVSLADSDQACILALFAGHIKDKFFELLTQDCLTYAIPGTIDEMNASTLIADTQQFHHFLQEMLFLGEDDHQLLEYAEKIECLFRNRFCTSIVDTAVDLMRKDLHDMVLMADSDVSAGVKQEAGVAASSGGSLLFARCMISKSVLELTSLLEKIVKQACMGGEGADEIAEHLYGSMADILERYAVEVPRYHAKLLATIPQQTALFHNNCTYLAYWVTTNLTHQQVESFASISNVVRSEGAKLFGQQMANQKRQLMEILYELGKYK
jgi:protein transport protein DSL1/ZW10